MVRAGGADEEGNMVDLNSTSDERAFPLLPSSVLSRSALLELSSVPSKSCVAIKRELLLRCSTGAGDI